MYTVTARLGADSRGNTTARAHFRSQAEHLGEVLHDASGTGAMRFELMEHRVMNDDAPFMALLVHWSRPAEAALPKFLQPHLPVVEEVRRYKSVFPPRGGWSEAKPVPEPGELGEVGRISLLVQHATMRVNAADAEAFRRQWPDLGYNSLGEPGVVRCDLLEEVAEEGQQGSADGAADADAAAATTFVARKVFRNAAAQKAHEAAEHMKRWREATAPMLQGKDGDVDVKMLDTILPRTSPYPFRSRWASVGA